MHKPNPYNGRPIPGLYDLSQIPPLPPQFHQSYFGSRAAYLGAQGPSVVPSAILAAASTRAISPQTTVNNDTPGAQLIDSPITQHQTHEERASNNRLEILMQHLACLNSKLSNDEIKTLVIEFLGDSSVTVNYRIMLWKALTGIDREIFPNSLPYLVADIGMHTHALKLFTAIGDVERVKDIINVAVTETFPMPDVEFLNTALYAFKKLLQSGKASYEEIYPAIKELALFIIWAEQHAPEPLRTSLRGSAEKLTVRGIELNDSVSSSKPCPIEPNKNLREYISLAIEYVAHQHSQELMQLVGLMLSNTDNNFPQPDAIFLIRVLTAHLVDPNIHEWRMKDQVRQYINSLDTTSPTEAAILKQQLRCYI